MVFPPVHCKQRCCEKSDRAADKHSDHKLDHIFNPPYSYYFSVRFPADSIKAVQPFFYSHGIVLIHFIDLTSITFRTKKLTKVIFGISFFVQTFKIAVIDLIYRTARDIYLTPMIQQFLVLDQSKGGFIYPLLKAFVFLRAFESRSDGSGKFTVIEPKSQIVTDLLCCFYVAYPIQLLNKVNVISVFTTAEAVVMIFIDLKEGCFSL